MSTKFVCFNELSFPDGRFDSLKLLDYLRQLAILMKTIQIAGIRYLRVCADFRNRKSREGELALDLILKLPHAERNLLLKAGEMKHLEQVDVLQVEQFISLDIAALDDVSCELVEGYLWAHIYRTVAVSLASHQWWNTDSHRVVIRDSALEETFVHNSRHASMLPHVEKHLPYLCAIAVEEVVASSQVPLPNVDRASEAIAPKGWGVIYKEINNLCGGEKISKIQKIAEAVAIANGYVFSEKISTLNQRQSGKYRQIFFRDTVGGRIYLSTDFDKGAFEVCDENGGHLGEWLFDGKQHQLKDDDGKHNIFLSSP